MKIDFTLKAFKLLLDTFIANGYQFISVKDYLDRKEGFDKIIILRHDIDLLPQNALIIAQIENYFGINGSYYFRATPNSWDDNIVKEISKMGHEVGYHYETMDTANGDIDLAWKQFVAHLNNMKKITDIHTICMHGSPRSKFDNKDLWGKYDYKKLGIIGEPYYDIDFNKIFYLTDTGRRWDGWKVSIRDKVAQQNDWVKKGLTYNSTYDIMKAIQRKDLPDKIMFTFHPQRWHSNILYWLKELLFQNIKNIIKKLLFIK